jgi:hypothetical protein
MTKSTDTLIDARHCYIALSEDANRELELDNIIGKEYLNGEVDQVPTLVRSRIL